jgi:hypothetical protein
MTKEARQYVAEWTGKTGRAPSDVYVPLALRTAVVPKNAHKIKEVPQA